MKECSMPEVSDTGEHHGDIVFVGATCARPLADPIASVAELGALAADVVARAIARGVYEARALPFAGTLPSWRDRFSAR